MKMTSLLLVGGILGLIASIRAAQSCASTVEPAAQTIYYPNGQLQSEVGYQDGKKDGLCKKWYADGTKMAEGRFAAGRMEGEWSFWREDGTIDPAKSGHYRDGERVGQVGGE